MLEAFIIVLREGFEAFLIVAIIFAYLRKTGQRWLLLSVYAAILAAVCSSLALGYLIKQGINQSFWEGVFGVIAIVFVGTLVIHMRRVGPHLMQRMNARLDSVSVERPRFLAYLGVFLFTALMITREGMETALMLTQVRGRYLTGALLGLAGATLLAIAWARFGHLINMKRFFQVTSIFLLLFIFQIALYSFHEFAEAGLLPNSEVLHAATEKFSPDGVYGKWFSPLMITFCGLWLLGAWLIDRAKETSVGGISKLEGAR